MTVIAFGEGRQIPTMGAAGAENQLLPPKLGKLVVSGNGEQQVHIQNTILNVQPGQTVANFNPGGGGFGDPFQRPAEAVLSDVINGLVSVEAARLEYGVVLDASGRGIDLEATSNLRRQRAATSDHSRV